MVATGLLALFQIGSSFWFYKQTRNMKEVGWMPHLINISTIISGILISYNYWSNFKEDTKTILYSLSVIGHESSTMARYRFMIRLIRVQLQIMSEKELTKIIIKQINRSKIIEYILLALITIIITCFVAFYLPKGIINDHISNFLYFKVVGPS